MKILLSLAGGVFALTILAAIWWYYPFVRKPWGPRHDVTDRLRKISGRAGTQYPPEMPRVVIHKARRELWLYEGETFLKLYPVALGTNPVEDKRKEGDGCTPEGDFYVCTRNERSRYHLFLGLSYPNSEDAERGKESGLISNVEYNRIRETNDAKGRPPWDTRLGGEIGIHGGGTASDWTLGCIAMSNEDIEELFMFLDIGSPVTITHE